MRRSEDLCPYIFARLSEGSVENGKIECLYHGWKFDKSGDCVKIPQLLPNAIIPKQACVKMCSTAVKEGILWVWMDTPDYNK
jgi:phenylpropionate dioxygenase-like ring-hydroxylating dioxygenase large terminal subunit